MSERQPEKWHRHDPHGSRDMHMAASQHSGILYGYPLGIRHAMTSSDKFSRT